jgi:hypothetical protein
MSETGFWLIMCALIVMFGVVYFIPSMIGARKRNAVPIFVLNLLLGWTFIGWVGALIWALCEKRLKNYAVRIS